MGIDQPQPTMIAGKKKSLLERFFACLPQPRSTSRSESRGQPGRKMGRKNPVLRVFQVVRRAVKVEERPCLFPEVANCSAAAPQVAEGPLFFVVPIGLRPALARSSCRGYLGEWLFEHVRLVPTKSRGS